MKRIKLTQAGFSAIEGLLIAIVVVLVAGIGYYVYQSGQTSNDNANQQTEQQSTDEATNEEAEAGSWRMMVSSNSGGFRGYGCRVPNSRGIVKFIAKKGNPAPQRFTILRVTANVRPNYKPNSYVTVLNRVGTLYFPNSNVRISFALKYYNTQYKRYLTNTGTVSFRSLPVC